MIIHTSKKGQLGEMLCLTDTLGENSVCDKEFVCRLYNATCEKEAGLIPIFMEWMGEAIEGHEDEKVISNDVIKLELFLNKNYIKKRKLLSNTQKK